MVDGAALEKRCAKAPRVRIPPSPPHMLPDLTVLGGVRACAPRSRTFKCARFGARTRSCQAPPSRGAEGSCRPDRRPGLRSARPLERSPSGLWRRTGNAVRGNPSRVRIPPSPPPLTLRAMTAAGGVGGCAPRSRTLGCARSGAPRRLPIDHPRPELTTPAGTPLSPGRWLPAVNCPGRARRGTSGALYLQSAPAGLNPLPRSPSSNATRRCDVEDRVPRIGEPRTVSGPEGSSTKRSSSGAAARPDPSRPSWWARGRSGRRRVHGTSFPLALDRRTR